MTSPVRSLTDRTHGTSIIPPGAEPVAPALSVSARTRRTPYTDRVEAAGVQAYTVYNHMLLPTVFESLEADAAHLKQHVQVWDVSCQRQVEVQGPDARRLVQLCTPRDLSRLVEGQCKYSPMVDDSGGMLNDPVVMQVSDDRFRLSIADHDMLLWLKGLAHGAGLRATVDEAEVWPVAVQGPKSGQLMARVFGEAVHGIRFFRFVRLPFGGHTFPVARSGFSKQGGFEIYLDRADLAEPLWDALMEAGADLEVRAGGPNLLERIEGGLLSYGNDMTRANDPYECGLGALCRFDTEPRCIGADALERAARETPRQQIRGLRIDGGPVPTCHERWPIIAGDSPVGAVSSATWSPDCATNVAIGMVAREYWEAGTAVEVAAPDGIRPATVTTLPHCQGRSD